MREEELLFQKNGYNWRFCMEIWKRMPEKYAQNDLAFNAIQAGILFLAGSCSLPPGIEERHKMLDDINAAWQKYSEECRHKDLSPQATSGSHGCRI
jgi:hypothetical protein